LTGETLQDLEADLEKATSTFVDQILLAVIRYLHPRKARIGSNDLCAKGYKPSSSLDEVKRVIWIAQEEWKIFLINSRREFLDTFDPKLLFTALY